MGSFFHSRQPRESDPRADRACLLRERSRETPFCVKNLKRVSAFIAQLRIGTSLHMQTPHRSGRASSSRGLCSPFNDEAAGLPVEGAWPGTLSATEAVKKKPRRDPRGLQYFRLIPITRPDPTKLTSLDSFVPKQDGSSIVWCRSELRLLTPYVGLVSTRWLGHI